MGNLFRRAIPVLVALSALAGAASAEYSIQALQLGQVPQNTIVDVNDVVVTAVGRFGFFVQEPNSDPVYGRQYSGCWVYTNTQPTLQDGDLVNIHGKYYEYNCAAGGSPCQTEIDVFCSDCQGRVTRTGTATVPAPVPMTIPEVNDTGAYSAAYEGVLVHLDREDNTLIAQRRVDTYNWMLKRGVGQDSITVTKWSTFPGGEFNYDIPDPGTPVSFAAGVLTWKNGLYRLAPRDCENDLGIACPLNIQGAWAISTTQIGVRFGAALNQ